MTRPGRFGTTGKAGVFDFYKSVFRDDDEATYATLMGEKYAASKSKSRYYRQWRTFQMSDHLVLWVGLKTDFSDTYLADMRGGTRKGTKKAVRKGKKSR